MELAEARDARHRRVDRLTLTIEPQQLSAINAVFDQLELGAVHHA